MKGRVGDLEPPACAAPVLTGTRVMLDYLEDGQLLERFVDLYRQISREQAGAALEEIKTMLTVSA